MFTEKFSTEIIEIDHDIAVVGLSLQKSGLPITFESLGNLWKTYKQDNYCNKIRNKEMPYVEYAVCLNKIPDYITGCSVSDIGNIDERCISYVIPKGRYIKDTFNAESFEQLTGEVMGKRNVKAWAKKNKLKVNNTYTVEVYPTESFDNNVFEMYTLTPLVG